MDHVDIQAEIDRAKELIDSSSRHVKEANRLLKLAGEEQDQAEAILDRNKALLNKPKRNLARVQELLDLDQSS